MEDKNNVEIVCSNHSVFSGKTINLNEQDIKVLIELVNKDRENLDKRFSNCIEQCKKITATKSYVSILYLCASCNSPVFQVIKSGFLSGQKLIGVSCNNANCNFFSKFVPIKDVDNLTKRFSLPSLVLQTEAAKDMENG